MRCYSLTDVKLPSSVEKTGYLSFCQCTALRSISFYNPDCVIGDEGENAITEAGRKYDNLEFQNSCTLNNTTVIDEDNHILYGVYSGIKNGFDNSTAQEFAEKYGYEFAPIQTTNKNKEMKEGRSPDRPFCRLITKLSQKIKAGLSSGM